MFNMIGELMDFSGPVCRAECEKSQCIASFRQPSPEQMSPIGGFTLTSCSGDFLYYLCLSGKGHQGSLVKFPNVDTDSNKKLTEVFIPNYPNKIKQKMFWLYIHVWVKTSGILTLISEGLTNIGGVLLHLIEHWDTHIGLGNGSWWGLALKFGHQKKKGQFCQEDTKRRVFSPANMGTSIHLALSAVRMYHKFTKSGHKI